MKNITEQGSMKMKFRPQLKAAAWGVSLALLTSSVAYAGGWGAPTQGDSGQGVDTVIGNSLNPRGLDTTLTPDENGLGPFRAPVAHTPTGSQYSIPWTEPTDTGLYANIEFGFIGSFGDADAAKFTEYSDYTGLVKNNNGVTVNSFNVGGERSGHYFNLFGGGVSNDDQYYGGAIGAYNDWRVRFFYNQTPHVFTTTARSIFNESSLGTGYMSLKPTLASTSNPGSTLNTPAAVIGAIQQTVLGSMDTTVALQRDKGGLRYDQVLNDKWSFYSSYTLETRTGGRPWGQTGGGFPGFTANGTGTTNGGTPVEMVEPIAYKTHDVALGTGYTDRKNSLNFAVTASIFQDDIKQAYWENPFILPNANFNRHVQQFTTPPSNQAYYLKGDYTRRLSFWESSFSIEGSYGWLKQNDDLQTTVSPFVTGTMATAPGDFANDMSYWNSLYGPNGLPTLSRLSSGLNNNTYVANLNWNAAPTEKLNVGVKARFYGYNDNNDYLACNPSLAAAYGTNCNPASNLNNNLPIYGFVIEDGAFNNALGGFTGPGGLASAVTNGGGIGGKVRSFDTSNRQQNYALSADYVLTNKISVNANLERENVYRAERERDWTYENKFKFGLVDRGLASGTLRFSYEYANRTGSSYKNDPYGQTYCAAWYVDTPDCMVAGPNTNGGFGGTFAGGAPVATANPVLGTKYDLADRKTHTVIARYNYAFTETLDAMLTGKLKNEKYPDLAGRGTRRENSLSAELSYQPSVTTGAYASLTYQGTSQGQDSVMNFYGTCTSLFNCSTVLPAPGASVIPNSAFGNINTVTTGNTAQHYNTSDKNWYFSLGANHAFAKVRVDANYSYTRTQSPVSYYAYNYATSVITNAANSFSFPDTTWNRHQLTLNATYPVNDKLAVRALYKLDKADVKDWHYDGLSAAGQIAGGTGTPGYYIDGGPAQSYVAHVFGVFAQYRM